MDSIDKTPEYMNRREAIRRVSAMLGGASFVGGTALLEGCVAYHPDAGSSSDLFTGNDIALLDDIADTILPDTDTPGAKAAGVGPFIAVMVADTYYPNDQTIFLDGLASFQDLCLKSYGGNFPDMTPAQRLELVQRLDREQYDYMNGKHPESPTHYFRMVKQLTLLGYFTSEIGYTQAMRYIESPGRFESCSPLETGDTIWADHA